MLPSAMIQTDRFKAKYEETMVRIGMMTFGRHQGILSEILEEERVFLADLRKAPDEYDEIMAAQVLMDGPDGT